MPQCVPVAPVKLVVTLPVAPAADCSVENITTPPRPETELWLVQFPAGNTRDPVELLLITMATSLVFATVVVIPGIVIVAVLLAGDPKVPTTSTVVFLKVHTTSPKSPLEMLVHVAPASVAVAIFQPALEIGIPAPLSCISVQPAGGVQY